MGYVEHHLTHAKAFVQGISDMLGYMLGYFANFLLQLFGTIIRNTCVTQRHVDIVENVFVASDH